MTQALFIVAVYGWLGFTVGYFFRKWLEGSWLPHYRAQQDSATPEIVGRAGACPEPAEWVPGATGAPVEYVDWIDEDGRLLQTLSRREMRRRNLLHRSTATFVFHPDGRLFIQQRTRTKDVYAGLYDVCVGGTVVSGETWEQNACREIAEELGIRGVAVRALFTHRFQDAHVNNAIGVFACVYDGPITLQQEEVAEGFWANAARVEALLATGTVCPDSAQGWRMYQQRFGGKDFARDIAPGLTPIRCAG